MEQSRNLGTREKALKINLDRKVYGSFAEIGAGQEVAATFFQAGGASGTIALSVSAYDMKISDSFYGECERYVCEPRLTTILDKEYQLLQEKLAERADQSLFFAFADTVEMLNYYKTNKGHGWLGIRFQLAPNSPPNECVLHVVLNDNDGLLQQKAIGRLGVNLIYACYHYADNPELFVQSLTDDLSDRVEIDMLRLTGPDFDHVDNRIISLSLVRNGMTDAALFGPDGRVLQASQALYKKNILVLRGRFRPVTHVNLDMLTQGLKKFRHEEDVDPDNVIVIFELTLKDLTAGGAISEKDFLDRVDILCSLGHTVMISNYQKYYKVVSYLSDSTRNRKVGVILGIHNLTQIFDDSYYDLLKGRLLESVGILFGRNVKLYAYPAFNPKDPTELQTCANLKFDEKTAPLFQYLMANNKIADIPSSNEDILQILSDRVLEMIREGKPGWESMVPSQVATMIKENRLFNYSPPSPVAIAVEE